MTVSCSQQTMVYESICESYLGFDTMPIPFSRNHIRKIIKEVNCMLVNIKIAFTSVDQQIFSKQVTAYIRPKSEHVSQV